MMLMRHKRWGIHFAVAVGAASLMCVSAVNAATQLFGPTPYFSSADSPFTGLSFIGGLTIEDFEDGLNTAGLIATHSGVVHEGNPQVDSVDGDDGDIDNFGNDGASYFSNAVTQTLGFEFDASVLGGLPTHAGLVWTDVGNLFSSDVIVGVADVSFSAYDASNQLIGTIGPSAVGDGSTFGQTAEDRFFGIQHDAGILRIEITQADSNDFEIDHVQFATAVPVPAAIVFMIPGLLALLGFRR